MAEYISREKAIETIQYIVCQGHGNKALICKRGSCAYCGIMEVMSYISSIEAADVQPIRRGRWIPQGDDMWLCSNCKENIIFSMHESDRTEKQRYCNRCGTRMDGGIDG